MLLILLVDRNLVVSALFRSCFFPNLDVPFPEDGNLVAFTLIVPNFLVSVFINIFKYAKYAKYAKFGCLKSGCTSFGRAKFDFI